MGIKLATTKYIHGYTWIRSVRVILRGGVSYYGNYDEQTAEDNAQDSHDTRDWAGDENWPIPPKWMVMEDVEPEVNVWPGGYWQGWS